MGMFKSVWVSQEIHEKVPKIKNTSNNLLHVAAVQPEHFLEESVGAQQIAPNNRGHE